MVEGLLRAPFVSRLGYIERERFSTALFEAKSGQLPAAFVFLFRALSLEVWLRDVAARGVLAIEPETPATPLGNRDEATSLTEKARSKWATFC